MPKGPFEIASPERALSRDLIAYNTGNLIFLEAAYKLLDTRDAVITPDRLEAPTIDPGSINERFDVYVVTLANAFRPSFETYLQAPLPYESGASRAWDDSVKAFVRAVLDRSPSIGVRGEYTQDYLNQLGFRDVEVIGCPSMFLYGDRMTITKRTPTLERDARIAINIATRTSSTSSRTGSP